MPEVDRMRRFLLVLLALAIAASGVSGQPASATRMLGAVRVSLELSKSAFRTGEPVDIRLTIVNPGAAAAAFEFPTSQVYDFAVLRDGERIWQWSAGRAFAQVITRVTIGPGESRTYSARWDQRDALGRPAPPGRYELLAFFPAAQSRALDLSQALRVGFELTGGSIGGAPGRPVIQSRIASIGGVSVGEVVVNGSAVLRIRREAGGLRPAARAEIIAARLRRRAGEGMTKGHLRVAIVGGEAGILWGDHLIVTVDTTHARLSRTTPRALAERWLRQITQALFP